MIDVETDDTLRNPLWLHAIRLGDNGAFEGVRVPVRDCATSVETMRASSWAERNRRSWRGDLRAIGPADLVPGTENDNKSTGGDKTFRTSSAVSRMTKTWTVSGIPGLLVLVPVTVCATITYVNQDSSRCNERSNSKISTSEGRMSENWVI